jgi:serine/threonine protein kinase
MESLKNYDTDHTIIFQSPSSIIFETTNLQRNKKVLIKSPSKKYPSPKIIQNMKNEFQHGKMLSELYPKNFVNVYEFIETDSNVYLVSEREGVSLDEILKKKQKFELEEFLKLAVDITSSIECIHNVNMIHLDVKPSNIIVTPEGKFKIIDFGLSVLVSKKNPSITCNSPTGTFLYMR